MADQVINEALLARLLDAGDDRHKLLEQTVRRIEEDGRRRDEEIRGDLRRVEDRIDTKIQLVEARMERTVQTAETRMLSAVADVRGAITAMRTEMAERDERLGELFEEKLKTAAALAVEATRVEGSPSLLRQTYEGAKWAAIVAGIVAALFGRADLLGAIASASAAQ